MYYKIWQQAASIDALLPETNSWFCSFSRHL